MTKRLCQTQPNAPRLIGVLAGEGQMLTGADGTKHNRIALVLRSPGDLSVESWQYQIKTSASNNWQALETVHVSPNPIFISNVAVDTYDIRARARRADGIYSQWLDIPNVQVTGKKSTPPAVPHLRVLPGTTYGSWYYDQERGVKVPADLAGFELRWNLGVSTDWRKATVLIPLTSHTHADLSMLPHGELVTLLVCATDVYGNQSAPIALQLILNETPLKNSVVHAIDLATMKLTGAVLKDGEIVVPSTMLGWRIYGKAIAEFDYKPAQEQAIQIAAELDTNHWRIEYFDRGHWHVFPGVMKVAAQPYKFRIVLSESVTKCSVIKSVTIYSGELNIRGELKEISNG